MAQEYPIQIMDEGHILVKVKLSDSISGNFVLDTGAGANVLSQNLFQKIEHKAEDAGFFTGFRHDGDRLDGEVYQIPYLSIGEVKQPNPIVGVYPPLDGFGIDGLLSLKFFEDKPFMIDFKGNKIKFLPQGWQAQLTEPISSIPIYTYKHTNILLDIFIPITLNNTLETLAEFDTGSGYGAYILNPGYIAKLGIAHEDLTKQPYRTQLSGQERQDLIYNMSSISIGGTSSILEKENIGVIFREGLICNALIGSGMFKNQRIVIDIPNRTFHVLP